MKPKASTMQERMGFNDPDLKSPIHDKMVIWLMKNKVSVANYLLGNIRFQSGSNDKRCEDMVSAMDKTIHDPDPVVRTEKPIMSGDFIIGFIDVSLANRGAYVSLDSKTGEVGWTFSGTYPDVNIEVKPKIESFGETMRQINMYREYERCQYAIFTPDHRFKDAFESQGIKVFKSTDVPIIG